MRENFKCPFCQKTVDIDLAQELERGETDLSGTPNDRQNLKIDLPKRLLVVCPQCTREFVAQPGQSVLGSATNGAGL